MRLLNVVTARAKKARKVRSSFKAYPTLSQPGPERPRKVEILLKICQTLSQPGIERPKLDPSSRIALGKSEALARLGPIIRPTIKIIKMLVDQMALMLVI